MDLSISIGGEFLKSSLPKQGTQTSDLINNTDVLQNHNTNSTNWYVHVELAYQLTLTSPLHVYTCYVGRLGEAREYVTE